MYEWLGNNFDQALQRSRFLFNLSYWIMCGLFACRKHLPGVNRIVGLVERRNRKRCKMSLKTTVPERIAVMKKSEIAVTRFLDGYNCAQAVLYAFCDDLHLDADTALRLACGFGAGIARRQEFCGAISGGIMAIGHKYGRGEGQDRTHTEETYQQVKHLISRFEEAQGSCICRNLLHGCDLSTPEGQAYFKENEFNSKVCKGCIETVADTVESILSA
jgi:C_GCAxxG_C_C family probable redox protein